MRITALHIDHGLHPDSRQWCRHCHSVAAGLGLDFRSLRLPGLVAQGSGLEAAARIERYRALARLNEGHCILTGHHQQDQAETVLLRLIRGSGVAGLAAMQAVSRIEGALVLRPFLPLPKQRLQIYANNLGLEWLEDPSNQNFQHDRNRIRHLILPQIRHIRSGVDQALARVGRHMTQAQQLLEEVAQADLVTVTADVYSHFTCAAVLDCQRLRAMSAPRRTNLLRFWLQPVLGYVPSERRQHALDRLVGEGQSSGMLRLGRHTCRRYRESLHLLTQLPAVPAHTKPAFFPGRWQAASAEISMDGERSVGVGLYGHDGGYEVRFRSGGERIHWHGHHRSLKGLFQRFSIPTWEREILPLLYVEGVLVAVADLWIADDWQVQSGEPGISLYWR